MSSAGDPTNGQSQSLRLLFDGGTLIAEGIAANEEPDLPGVKLDNRTRQFRAEAIWYRTIVEHIRKNKRLIRTGRAPTSRPTGGCSWPKPLFRIRSKGWKPGGTRGGGVSSFCRREPARLTSPAWPSSGPAGPHW